MALGGQRRRKLWRALLLGAGMFVVLALVVLSPLGLSALDRLSERDWQRLSAIGQTYGAMSTLLAAVALGGVLVSIRQQSRSAQVDREHIYRTVHLELARMMLDHPDLMDAFAPLVGGGSVQERRLNTYRNQQVLAMQMGFEIGALGEEYLTGAAREMFGDAANRGWWSLVRAPKRAVATNDHQRRMLDIFDREWRRSSGGVPAATPATVSDAGPDPGIEGLHVTGLARPGPHGVRSTSEHDRTRPSPARAALAGMLGIALLMALRRTRRARRRRLPGGEGLPERAAGRPVQ